MGFSLKWSSAPHFIDSQDTAIRSRVDWIAYCIIVLASVTIVIAISMLYNTKRDAFQRTLISASQLQVNSYGRMLDIWLNDQAAGLDTVLYSQRKMLTEFCAEIDCKRNEDALIDRIQDELEVFLGMPVTVQLREGASLINRISSGHHNRTHLQIVERGQSDKTSDSIQRRVVIEHKMLLELGYTRYGLIVKFGADEALRNLYGSAIGENVHSIYLFDHSGNRANLLNEYLTQLTTAESLWRLQGRLQDRDELELADLDSVIDNIIHNSISGTALEGVIADMDNVHAAWSDDPDFGFGLIAIVEQETSSGLIRYTRILFIGFSAVLLSVYLLGIFYMIGVRKRYERKTANYLDALQNKVESRTQALYAIQTKLNEANNELRRRADTDALTGLATRGHFYKMAEDYWYDDHVQSAAILMLDVDHFKKINDTYGHLVGDECLAEVGRLLKNLRIEEPNLRSVARYGGEEFILLCTDISTVAVYDLAERVRKTIASNVLTTTCDEQVLSLQLTVSIGAASTPKPRESNIRSIIEDADKALYQAKNGGRNCCVMHESTAQRIRLHSTNMPA